MNSGFLKSVASLLQVDGEIQEREERFRALVQNSFDIITIHDNEGATIYESPAASRILGYPPGSLIGKAPFQAVHPGDVDRAREAFHTLATGSNRVFIELRYRRADGSWIWLEIVGNNLLEHPGVQGVVLTSRDVTERKHAEERAQYLANYDVLTGLPNRTLMYDRVSQAVAYAKRSRERIALLHVDVDRFKMINDSLGHEAGDEILKAAAERIKRCTGESDTVARVGGDEFTILMPDAGRLGDVTACATKILSEMSQPFPGEREDVFVTASIGVSLFPDDSRSADTLTKHADAAMHSAKTFGRNNYQFFTQALNEEVQQRMVLESGLRLALTRDEMRLVYQPKVDLVTREIIGAEALLRWHHPKHGLIPPARFIPVAEESGLVGQIGEWVLRDACRQIHHWQKMGLSPQIAVNVSARQFQQYDVAKLVSDVIGEAQISPESLEIELTESAVMHDAEASIITIEKLKQLGVRVSIDDFGTGYSSLSYLKRLPLDLLKIDQSFVRDISSDPNDAAIVRAIITLARNLGMKVIAEGVEDDAQLAFLNAYGCQYAQGFLFGQPMTAEELTWRIRPPEQGSAAG
ncbi:MAG: EAL domain-containing protein [Betaproteobacteria bacterium]|nr:MAG: EAL domain-containing protein [Betaproteobacteria bacterium]